MTIWLLGILLLASLAGLGLRQGAVRVAFSLVGILLGALLAGPLGKLIKPLLLLVGVKDPMILHLVPPLLGFIIISIIFKVAALSVHHKIDVHFKYHAGDLRLALYERLHHRLGLCLGLFNGAAYFVLISWVIFVLSYWTYQTATSPSDPWQLRLVNRLGKDLQSSRFAKVARSIDPLADTVYKTADIAGLIYGNPLLEARLSRYPAFLGLAERPEFQTLANDQEFMNMRQRQDPILTVLKHPPVQGIFQSREMMDAIKAALVPNLADLQTFLTTGKSPKFDAETILGRWDFDLNYTMIMVHKVRTNISSIDLPKIKRAVMAGFAKATFVATTEHQAILKSVPRAMYAAGGVPSTDIQTLQGQWQGADGKYQLTLTGKDFSGTVEGDRLMMSGDGLEIAFVKED
jgi:hypothetical protein